VCLYCGQEETSLQQLDYNSLNSRSDQNLVSHTVFGADLLLESGLVMVVEKKKVLMSVFLFSFKVWIKEQFIVGTNADSFHCTDSRQ